MSSRMCERARVWPSASRGRACQLKADGGSAERSSDDGSGRGGIAGVPLLSSSRTRCEFVSTASSVPVQRRRAELSSAERLAVACQTHLEGSKRAP